MESGALSEEKFAEWGQGFVLFCHITSRVKDDKHQDLLEEKGGRGFPYFVFLDEKGDLITKHQGPRSVEGFTASGEKVKRFFDAKVKAEKGDEQAILDYLVLQVEFGKRNAADARKELADAKISDDLKKLGDFLIRLHAEEITAEEADKELKGLKVSVEKRKELEAMVADLEVNETLKSVTREKDTRVAAGKKFAEMEQAGRIPGGDREIQAFWILMMDYAESEKNIPLFEKGLTVLKEKYGDNEAAKRFFDQKEETLKKLKEEGK